MVHIQSLDLSVGIPTYNGASRLPKLLDALFKQIGLENISWEIIVVDNNSNDNTCEIIRNYQLTWNYHFPLIYLKEQEQGAAFARLRALKEARGEITAFLDDDILPDPRWVEQAYAFGQKHKLAGAWSGQIHGDFDSRPPENFKRIQAFIAIREHGNEPFLFDANNLRLPTGAAFVVRKQVWCDSVPNVLVFKGRQGSSMVGGEDLEPLLYIHSSGWQIWYNPAMHTLHQIPHWRLEKDYLLSLARGCGLSICELRYINAKPWEKPIVFARTFLGNLRRVFRHLIKYRGQLKDDLIARFEIEFYLSSMISPFYSLKLLFTKIFK